VIFKTLQVLGWAEEAYKRAKGITRELRTTLSLVQVRIYFKRCYFDENDKVT
jgi:hypothetical protein